MAWEPVYAEVGELAAYKGVGGLADNEEMADALEAASRVIDDVCGRQFGGVGTGNADTRVYPVQWDRHLGLYVAEIDDLMTTTALVVQSGSTTLTTADYVLLPRNADKTGDPWTELGTTSAESPTVGSGPWEITVTAEWGWPAVPQAIKQATLLQAARILKRRDAPLGVAGSPEMGTETRLLSKEDADARVIAKVAKYERNRLFA